MRIKFNSAVVFVAGVVLTAIASPAGLAAQARQRGDAPAQGQAVPRQQAEPVGRQAEPPRQPEARSGEAPRSAPQRSDPQPRSEPQRIEPQRAAPSSRAVPAPRLQAVPRTVPRDVRPDGSNGRPGNDGWDGRDRRDNPVYRPDYRPDYRPTYRPQYGPNYRPAYRPDYRPYYRPYYVFQPRFHLRFGLWAGHAVAYPYYLYPAATYPYPYTSGYPVTVYAVPGATPAAIGAAGGLSFDIQPADARIYVDRQYVGVAAQFLPTEPPLSLAPGRHRVEIHAPGFEVIAFDVDILPGQVIPYQGELRLF